MDLFASAAEERLTQPGAARGAAAAPQPRRGRRPGRPARRGRPLRLLIESDRLTSVVLWGPPGTGKTSIARLIAGATRKAFEPLSAVSAGVKDVREVAERARQRLGEHGQGTILFLDEVHRFSRTQQDALLPHVEEGLIVLVGATTENPYFSLTAPLLSRSTLFRLEPVGADDLRVLVERALTDDGTRARRRAPHDRARRARPPRRPRGGRRPPHAHQPRRRRRARVRGRLGRHRARARGDRARDARAALRRRRALRRDRPRSSRASAAPTSTPASTGWPA